MLNTLWIQIVNLVTKVASTLLSLFPQSPFADAINSFSPPEWIGWLNWFFPVGPCLSIMALWLTAIGLFYLYSIVARWIKVIGD